MKFRLGLFNRRAEPEEEQDNKIMGGEGDTDTLSALVSSGNVTPENAKNIATLVACVDKISEAFASAQIKLVEKENGKVKILPEDYRVRLLNVDAGDTLSSHDIRAALVRDMYLKKGGYAYVQRTGNRIQSIRYVKSDAISFMVNDDPIFKKYKIVCNGKEYENYDFLKILRHTTDGYKGKSIVDEQELLLSTVLASMKYEQNLVLTGGNKKGFLKSARKLSQEAITKLRKAWRNLYSNNSENVMVLNEGLDFKEASNTSVEMQLDQSKTTNGKEICKIFGIPPAIIEGNAAEADRIAFVQQCLAPLFRKIESELNRTLLLESEKGRLSFAIDADDWLKGNMKERYEAYKTGIEAGVLKVDEVREKENLEPIGMNLIRMNLGDVFYDPEARVVYVPNTGEKVNIELGKGKKTTPEEELKGKRKKGGAK